MKKIIAATFILLFSKAITQEVREYMDLQIHPTMHIRFGMFGEGLTWFEKENEPNLKHKHFFTNVNYANYYYKNEGIRIFVIGFIGTDSPTSRKKAKKKIIQQLDYTNKFVEENSDKFVLAKSPQEVRDYLKNTDKTIFIYSIEGATKLINSKEDAEFWASQGISFFTLIHLVDCEYGGAAIKPGLGPRIVNLKGVFKKFFSPKKRGLTEFGRQTIKWIHEAGMLTDLTHMSDLSRKDALDFMEENEIPPLVTHDLYKPIQNHPRGVDTNDLIRIYKLGGFFSLPVGGYSLKPKRPYKNYKNMLKEKEDYKAESIDIYEITYTEVQNLIQKNAKNILGSEVDFKDLPEEKKTLLSIGFQTDFNGWINHSKPKYGNKKEQKKSGKTDFSELDKKGLAHPGLMKAYWDELKNRGVDLKPLKRASERFLQIWQKAINASFKES